jgi:hypothetical protein
MGGSNEPPDVEREPASPIKYSVWAQRADRRHGQRDGRNRIPSLAEVNEILQEQGPAKMPTPYLEMLFSRARDMMEHERLWYIASTTTIRSELTRLASMAAAARSALGPAAALKETARAPVTEEDLLARHSAEELRSEVFIRLRREAEREQRIAQADGNYQRILSEIHGIEVRITEVRDHVQSRLSIARMRALRISAYFSARTATYWEGLIHAHRDGKHLAPLLPHLIPRLPLWVLPEEEESPDATPVSQPLTGTTTDSTATDDSTVENSEATPAPRPRADDVKTPTAASDGPAQPYRPTGGTDGKATQSSEDQSLPAHGR